MVVWVIKLRQAKFDQSTYAQMTWCFLWRNRSIFECLMKWGGSSERLSSCRKKAAERQRPSDICVHILLPWQGQAFLSCFEATQEHEWASVKERERWELEGIRGQNKTLLERSRRRKTYLQISASNPPTSSLWGTRRYRFGTKWFFECVSLSCSSLESESLLQPKIFHFKWMLTFQLNVVFASWK